MQSFLLVGRNQDKRQAYITDFCQQQKIGKFDLHYFTPEENAIGIQKVKDIQKSAYFKPISSTEKAVIIADAQLLTLDAQNALLKLLEEPPQNTYIFLSATTDTLFLPTILSRCKKIVFAEEKVPLTEQEQETLTEQLAILEGQGSGEKLFLAEKISSDKEHLGEWFEKMIFFLRECMLTDTENAFYPHMLQQIGKAHQLFQTTNVAPRVILEHTFLEI